MQFRGFGAIGDATDTIIVGTQGPSAEVVPASLEVLLRLEAKVLLLELELTIQEIFEQVAHLLNEAIEGGLVLESGCGLGVSLSILFGMLQLILEELIDGEDIAEQTRQVEVGSEVIICDKALHTFLDLRDERVTSLRNR